MKRIAYHIKADRKFKKESEEQIEIMRLTYDAEGKHFCDCETRDIINRLAECEIMLEKIEQIVEEWKDFGYITAFDNMTRIDEVLKDGKID